MAEGFLKKHFQQFPDFCIISAGIQVFSGAPATPEAVAAASERGADISRHTARMISREFMAEACQVIAMTRQHAAWLREHFPEYKQKIMTLGELAHGTGGLDVADPIGGTPDQYREIARQIEELILSAKTTLLGKFK
ncbi:hypothetical protein K8S19_10740 [bacterium]|nr:hypothetical protein [bacterium]